MKPYTPIPVEPFVNRQIGIARLQEIAQRHTPAIVVAYGRRRIGKTSLIERSYADRRILKFEGVEGRDEAEQRAICLRQLAQYTGDPLVSKVEVSCWVDLFLCIYRFVEDGPWTVYFDELQWLANYKDRFIPELKYCWDNHFRRNNELMMVLCGSSPSFMVGNVLHSKALHNRSLHEFPVHELALEHAATLLPAGAGRRDVMDTYLTVGGIPLYLQYFRSASSVFLSLCKESFRSGGFFAHEWDRVFVSSLASNPLYRRIVETLAQHPYLGRPQLAKLIDYDSGGRLTELLTDLERCGFIESYWPLHLKENTKLKRYALRDNYLRFYARFIRPLRGEIDRGAFDQEPMRAIDIRSYQQWLGYAFEQYCRCHHRRIATRLGFGAVRYRWGSYFCRPAADSPRGFQVDLCFHRDDRVLTVCEIKYTGQPVGVEVSHELDRKIDLIKLTHVQRIHKVLISAAGASEHVRHGPYFDDILTLEDFVG